jgi:N-acyl-D-aspartate/D-glutamate deacylase
VGNLDALREALRIGREAGAPVHIAHIKALGRDATGRARDMIALIEAARASGQRVTADQSPWTASGTRVSNAVIPSWTRDGGRDAMRRRLADPALQSRLSEEIAGRIRSRGGADTLLILSGGLAGQTLAQAAETAELEPHELARRIALEGDARLASFNMSEDEVRTFMALDWVVTSSDGTSGHPRKYASFALKYQRYVREQATISIGAFIRRSSGLTADILGLAERGYLREGYYADIVVFDAEEFAARADYANPEELSVGVRHVLVNGVVAIEAGAPNEALAGAAIYKPAREGSCA